jgi:hypothetical protein
MLFKIAPPVKPLLRLNSNSHYNFRRPLRGGRDAGFEGASRAGSACTVGSADDHAVGTLISGWIPAGFGVEGPRMHS